MRTCTEAVRSRSLTPQIAFESKPNYAIPNSETTSAVINPDGSLLTYQPHGQAGLLFAQIEPATATGYLAHRYRPDDHDV